MKKSIMAVLLALCASLAACRSAGGTTPPTNEKKTAAVMDEPIVSPKPSAPKVPTPPAPKVATPAVATAKSVPATPNWGRQGPPTTSVPKPRTEMETMRDNIVSARSAAEQVRVDLGADLEAVAEFSATRLATLEKRVGALEKTAPVPAPAPVAPASSPVVSASFNADDLSALKRAVAWDHPTLAGIFLGRLRTAFSGGDEVFWSALGAQAPDQKFQAWMAKARTAPKP